MGIFLTPSNSNNSKLICFQDGRHTEEYVAEFLGLSEGVSRAEEVQKTVFWFGLDENRLMAEPGVSRFSVISFR